MEKIEKFQRKIADQKKKIDILKEELDKHQRGSLEIQRMIDALLSTVAIHHGEKAFDDDGKKEIGWRLEIPLFDVDSTLREYEIHARKDTDRGTYVIGVAHREK